MHESLPVDDRLTKISFIHLNTVSISTVDLLALGVGTCCCLLFTRYVKRGLGNKNGDLKQTIPDSSL